MAESQKKKFDLEERTFKFAKSVLSFVRTIPRTMTNTELGRQLVRSSGSVGANYIEANEALSKKDFVMRIKICRKEAKESCYWLQLLGGECDNLIQESTELTKIFGAIVEKSK